MARLDFYHSSMLNCFDHSQIWVNTFVAKLLPEAVAANRFRPPRISKQPILGDSLTPQPRGCKHISVSMLTYEIIQFRPFTNQL